MGVQNDEDPEDFEDIEAVEGEIREDESEDDTVGKRPSGRIYLALEDGPGRECDLDMLHH